MKTECDTCGTDELDYLKDFGNDADPFEVTVCPFCQSDKCNRCNAGEDVPCMNCEDEE